MSSSRSRQKKNKNCDFDQLKNPDTHTCKKCSSFSEQDLREFAYTLEIETNDSMDKKQLCDVIKRNFELSAINQLDTVLRNSRYFVPTLQVTWNPEVEERMLSPALLKEVRKHELRAEQPFYTLDSILKEMTRQFSFIDQMLGRNQMYIFYRLPDGTYELVDDAEKWVKEQSQELDFFKAPHKFLIISDELEMGAIVFNITKKTPERTKNSKTSLLERLNRSGKKFIVQLRWDPEGPVESSTPFKTFEDARKSLEDTLNRIGPYYYFTNEGFKRISSNLINLYTRKPELVLTQSTWFTAARKPFIFRIQEEVDERSFKQMEDAFQLFAGR